VPKKHLDALCRHFDRTPSCIGRCMCVTRWKKETVVFSWTTL